MTPSRYAVMDDLRILRATAPQVNRSSTGGMLAFSTPGNEPVLLT